MNFKQFLAESKEKIFVVIGNPGRSRDSALYPETEKPKLYTEEEAKEICDRLNGGQKLTNGAIPSSVYWHYKPVTDALKYVSGYKASSSIKFLMKPEPKEHDSKESLTTSKEKIFVVIGNPGGGRNSALYPKTQDPKLYTEKEAKKICDRLNDTPKITHGAVPSNVHWHYKPIKDALKYVIGASAVYSIRDITPPDPDSWGSGPAKHRF